MPQEVTLPLLLEKPTAGVDFGLQEGRGSSYQVIRKQRSDGHDLGFEFNVTVKTARDSAPDFAGPIVQGSAGERFFYIDIGTCAGQANTEWSRRLKVPLCGITWDIINSRKVLIASIPGTGKDGGPSCAYEWRRRVDPSWRWRPGK
ncbi:MAG TPA: hypothetical protein DC054_06920 [Blastocatellia bacterium]|nr:hypothetical protein [Blastocatellia bacterium]